MKKSELRHIIREILEDDSGEFKRQPGSMADTLWKAKHKEWDKEEVSKPETLQIQKDAVEKMVNVLSNSYKDLERIMDSKEGEERDHIGENILNISGVLKGLKLALTGESIGIATINSSIPLSSRI